MSSRQSNVQLLFHHKQSYRNPSSSVVTFVAFSVDLSRINDDYLNTPCSRLATVTDHRPALRCGLSMEWMQRKLTRRSSGTCKGASGQWASEGRREGGLQRRDVNVMRSEGRRHSACLLVTQRCPWQPSCIAVAAAAQSSSLRDCA